MIRDNDLHAMRILWGQEDIELRRQHRALESGKGLPDLSEVDHEGGTSIGSPEDALVTPEAILASWQQRWSTLVEVRVLVARLERGRALLLLCMAQLPTDPPGPLTDARAHELGQAIDSIRREYHRWIPSWRAIASLWSVTASNVGTPTEPFPVLGLDPAIDAPLRSYNRIGQRLYRRTEQFRKKQRQRNAQPEAVAKRAAAVKRLRQDPVYRERERQSARARYQKRKELAAIVDALVLPDDSQETPNT